MSISRRQFIQSVGAAVSSSVLPVRAQPQSEYDFIVVGAGSSGCVLVNRLSADRNARVLLIEAGAPSSGDASIAAPGRWVSLLGSAWDWNYATESDAGLGGRSIRWPRGKAYGGSSAINAMAYVRGDRACYDRWATEAGDAWAYERLVPLFEGIERELAITETPDPHAGHIAFLEAARTLNLSPLLYRKTIRHGRRVSAADAFLTPALARPNLTVAPHTRVRRVVIEGGRAIGVEMERGGKTQLIRAARETVLCAGVIESPRILMLSGVGPAVTLKRSGIPALVDAPAVGRNLHDHARVSVRWKSRRPLPPSSASAGLFVASRNAAAGQRIADLQFYVGRGLDAEDDFVTLTVALSQPRSRGTITVRSADPLTPPAIHPNYFFDRADLDALADGVRLAREIAAARPYHELRGDPVDPSDAMRTEQEIHDWIRRTADTIFHPVGTCRMGRGSDAVVDGRLRVRGVERLRVADGSVMPTVVNSQTNAACMVIGARAAEFLRA